MNTKTFSIKTFKFKQGEDSFESLRDFIVSRYMELFEDPRKADKRLMKKVDDLFI